MGPVFPEALREAVSEGAFNYGRFAGLFERVNFLDAKRLYHYSIPRWVKAWRLKEWRAFVMGNERWFFLSSLYNAKLFSIALFKAYDRETKKRHGFVRIMPGSIITTGERLSLSHSGYHGRHARLDYDFNLPRGRIGLKVNWRPGHGEAGFHGEFELDYGPRFSAPSSVVLPMGLNRAMYTTKFIAPMRGFFEVEGEMHLLGSEDSTAFVDDNKGYYPFGLRYDWVGALGLDSRGRHVGFSLACSPAREGEKFNENSLWIGNRVWPLPPVRVTRAKGHGGSWVIQDTEGLVDLLFTPDAANDLNFHLGLLECDWHGPFGSFKGCVKNGEGDTIEAERLYGVGEDKYLRA